MPLRDPALINRQRAGAIVGHIRMGKLDANGRPQKHETFRLTTKSREIADSVARACGGEVRWWNAKNKADSAWEVEIADSLAVTIPPVQILDQWWKRYEGRECLRICDGVQQQKVQEPCVCPADVEERYANARSRDGGTACLPYTRLNVILPWVAGLGMWTLVSTGLWTALDLEEKAEQLQAARDAGLSLTAQLRLEKVAGKQNGQSTLWVVPRLYILDSLAEIQSGQLAVEGGTLRLPPPPQRLAIEAAKNGTAPAAIAPPNGEQSWPVTRQPPPSPPAPTAQQLANQATKATTRAEVAEIKAIADRLGLTVEHVTIDGAAEALDGYLRHRWSALPPASPRVEHVPDDGVPLPPEPEDTFR